MAQEIKYRRPSGGEHAIGQPFPVDTSLYGVNDPSSTTAWASSTAYTAGDIRKHGGRHWKALVTHVSSSKFEYSKWGELTGIPDETFYLLLGGSTISDAESPINGASVVDGRGLFPRGAGTNGTRTKASGSGYNGGNPGSYGNDKIQGFVLNVVGDSSGNGITHPTGGSVGGSNDTPASAPASGDYMKAKVFQSDGVNGTPRTGDETTPAYFAVWWYIKKR